MDETQVRDLVGRLVEGDEGAMRLLYEAFAPDVLRHCAHQLRHDHDAAEDVCQEVFLRAWRRIAILDASSSFRSWLLRIATNEILSRNRRKHYRLEFDDLSEQLMDAHADPADEYVTRETGQHLRAAVDQLSDAQRDVVMLVYFEGMSNAEAAEYLGRTEGSVKGLRKRAKESLAVLLDGTPARGRSLVAGADADTFPVKDDHATHV